MRSKEEVIREQRTIEAVRKGMMSGEGKLACIAHVFGDKVYGHHGGGRRAMFHEFENMMGLEQNFLDEDELEEGEIPLAEGMAANAYLFNGYSRGLHMEIKCDGPEIWVRWKGDIVYHELGGELAAYSPGDWEIEVDKLAVAARKKEYQYIEMAEKRDVVIGQRLKEQFLEEMKRKWGLK